MYTQLLRDESIFPSDEVLQKTLGTSFSAFRMLAEVATQASMGLTLEWRYYKDGKSWLCKASHKKKTIFWLSVWDKFFQVSFFFTEKTGVGIVDLDIAEVLKKDFAQAKKISKLIPMIIRVMETEQVTDVLKVAEYKRGLK